MIYLSHMGCQEYIIFSKVSWICSVKHISSRRKVPLTPPFKALPKGTQRHLLESLLCKNIFIKGFFKNTQTHIYTHQFNLLGDTVASHLWKCFHYIYIYIKVYVLNPLPIVMCILRLDWENKTSEQRKEYFTSKVQYRQIEINVCACVYMCTYMCVQKIPI